MQEVDNDGNEHFQSLCIVCFLQHCSHNITFKVNVCAQMKLSRLIYWEIYETSFCSVQRCVVWCRSQERVLMVGAIETRLSDPRLMLVFSTVLDLACLSWCRITTSKIFPEQIDNIFLVNIFRIEIPQPRSRLRTESCIYAIHRQQQTWSFIHWKW